MKTRNKLIGMAIAIITLALFSCGGDDTDPTHVHEWEWVVTQEGSATTERIETETCKIDGTTRGTRTVPIARQTTITLSVVSNPTYINNGGEAIVKGTLTLADLTTISNKLTTAINGAFTTAAIPPLQAKFVNVFDIPTGYGQVQIKIERDVNYTTYEVDDKLTIRFNFNYLLSVNANDLETTVDTAITEMSNKPFPSTAPKAQQTTQTITFDDGSGNEAGTVYAYSVTYQTGTGTTFTDSEWTGTADETGIVAKIETALISAYNRTGAVPLVTATKNAFRGVFGDGVTIIVEKNPNPDYANYKVVRGNYTTLYLNAVSALEDTVIRAAIAAMRNGDSTLDENLIGQAAPIKNKVEYMATMSNKNLNNPLVSTSRRWRRCTICFLTLVERSET